jgi:predicted ABC-type ATPase
MEGYTVAVMFFWLPSPDHAVARVRLRASRGGHDVAEEVVRRRYRTGISNFLSIYVPLADAWWLYDNENLGSPRLVARKQPFDEIEISEPDMWQTVQGSANG